MWPRHGRLSCSGHRCAPNTWPSCVLHVTCMLRKHVNAGKSQWNSCVTNTPFVSLAHRVEHGSQRHAMLRLGSSKCGPAACSKLLASPLRAMLGMRRLDCHCSVGHGAQTAHRLRAVSASAGIDVSLANGAIGLVDHPLQVGNQAMHVVRPGDADEVMDFYIERGTCLSLPASWLLIALCSQFT